MNGRRLKTHQMFIGFENDDGMLIDFDSDRLRGHVHQLLGRIRSAVEGDVVGEREQVHLLALVANEHPELELLNVIHSFQHI